MGDGMLSGLNKAFDIIGYGILVVVSQKQTYFKSRYGLLLPLHLLKWGEKQEGGQRSRSH